MKTNEPYAVTPRDLAVLGDLSRKRYLRTSQIQDLHFPSRRVANRRLSVFFKQGYIDRFRVPTIVGHGSSDYIYCLKASGEELLTNSVLTKQDAMRRPERNGRPKNSFLMEHHLAINDFWIALSRACQSADLDLKTFIPDYYGERTNNGGFRRLIADSTTDPECTGESLRFIPDAMFILERYSKQALFFLEIDRGTETVVSSRHAAFADKARAYLGYYGEKGFRRWGENFQGFRVLVVTCTQDRLANLMAATTEAGLQRLMWFTVGPKATGGTVLGPIWQVPGLEGVQSLVGK